MDETPKPLHAKNPEKERRAAFEALKSAQVSSTESIEKTEKKEDELDLDFENEKLSLENRKEKKEIRKRWNNILTSLVVLGFISSYVMIVLIGLGALNFDNNAFAVPSVVAAGVVETYGLAKLAIKYFFSEDD